MQQGHFYFIKDSYFEKFPDDKLMKNKEIIDGQEHNRPCFFSFKDKRTSIYWLIPFSSQTTKFQRIYTNKINKYGECDTIVFGKVLGHNKAFLIQNICPIIPKYINNEYINNSIPVMVDGILQKQLIQKAKKILLIQRKNPNVHLIFPNIFYIESILISELENS